VTASLVVGLTGGIGSGKSAAAEMFGALGAAIVDADVIAHELTGATGLAMPAIRAAFGTEVASPDGALNRAHMRQLVFNDATARTRLEAILHPMIRAETQRRGALALDNGAPYLMLVIPLLVESANPRERVNRVLVVDCADETQVARVITRSGLAEPEIRRIMATQATRQQRLEVADDVIDNAGDLEALRRQVMTLHQQYLGRAAQ
jgi:dephospho-CoA kinase